MLLIRPRFLSPSPPSAPRRELPPPPDRSRTISSAYSSSARPPGRRPRPSSSKPPPPPDLRRLTSRIVDLTRRRQLAQIMEEVEASKRRARAGRGGGVNTIVMNAVLEACVSCGDVDLAVRFFDGMRAPRGCGVDGVSYGILLKEICGVPMLLLPVFAKSFMKDTQSYYTTY